MQNFTANTHYNTSIFARVLAVFSVSTILFSSVAPVVHAAPVFTKLDRFQQGTEETQEFDGFAIPERGNNPHVLMTQKQYVADVTAYTSSVEECDADPFITADGSTTADGIVAANFLPFGTKIRIPSQFGDKIFTVRDRMNARYWYRVDIWMENKGDMRQFGLKKNATIEVVQWGDGKTQWAARAAEMKAKRLAEKN